MAVSAPDIFCAPRRSRCRSGVIPTIRNNVVCKRLEIFVPRGSSPYIDDTAEGGERHCVAPLAVASTAAVRFYTHVIYGVGVQSCQHLRIGGSRYIRSPAGCVAFRHLQLPCTHAVGVPCNRRAFCRHAARTHTRRLVARRFLGNGNIVDTNVVII